ncbi:MAG: hypothetical protein ACKVX7_08440 [Planctomycetota bacterium]
MKSQSEFMASIIGALDNGSIPYMICGSIGSSFHGEPRSTNDIDIVVNPTEQQLIELVRQLGREYYVSETAASQAFRSRSMFNVIDSSSGWKVDLIIRKDRPYSRAEFDRRIQANVLSLSVSMTAAEDVVLTKLEWGKLSESERHFRDAVGVLIVQKDQIDTPYLRHWAAELGVGDFLERALRASGIDI